MTTRLDNLSAYVICKNEADWIEPCIRSLACCAEIVVVDSGSQDGTLDILRRLSEEGFPLRIFEREWPGYAAQKQFALEQCTREWCLCIDADERMDDHLPDVLPSYLERKDVDGWQIELRSFIHGYGYAPDTVRGARLLRLSRNGKARYGLSRLVHESLSVEGSVGMITGAKLLHRRAPGLAEQMAKEINYSSLKAEQLFRAGRKPRYARLLFNPAIYFFRLFLLKRMFLVGWPGFIYCGTTAIYSFMTEAMLLQKHLAAKQLQTEPDEVFSNKPAASIE